MSLGSAPVERERYTSADFDQLGFHDCHVHGFSWPAPFELALDLDYILDWIAPAKTESYFKFRVAPATLRFLNVEDLRLEFDWRGLALDCSIQDIHRGESRETPNGALQWRWHVEFSTPDAVAALWAMDFELRLRAASALSSTQRLQR